MYGCWDGARFSLLTPVSESDGNTSYHVFPSESGMGDTFSPRNQTEWNLKQFLMKKHGEYIEIERIVSGPGLADVYRFLLSKIKFQMLRLIQLMRISKVHMSAHWLNPSRRARLILLMSLAVWH